MKGRQSPAPAPATEESADNFSIHYDTIYMVGESLPLNSKALSSLCRSSHRFYNSFQEARITTLLSKLLTECDVSKIPGNIQAVRKILAIQPRLINATVNLHVTPLGATSDAQSTKDQAQHRNILFHLIDIASTDENAKWVVDILKLLHHNHAIFGSTEDHGCVVLNYAVKQCAADIIYFMYDHHLVDYRYINSKLLYILENEFGVSHSNWQGRKSRLLDRLCIEQPFLLFRHDRLISPREYTTLCVNIDHAFQISRHTYLYHRYHLTQFYRAQLTEITPQRLFDGLINQCGEMLEKDIEKILNHHILGLAKLDQLQTMLTHILLAEHTKKNQPTLGKIGVLLYQHCIQNEALTSNESQHLLMLAATFFAAGGKASMMQAGFIETLLKLIGARETANQICLQDFISSHSEALLNCIERLIEFYCTLTKLTLEPLDPHPFVTLQAYAASCLKLSLKNHPSASEARASL